MCILLDPTHHLLCGGQVATVEHDDHAFAGRFKHRHLAKRGHVVYTGIGA